MEERSTEICRSAIHGGRAAHREEGLVSGGGRGREQDPGGTREGTRWSAEHSAWEAQRTVDTACAHAHRTREEDGPAAAVPRPRSQRVKDGGTQGRDSA